MQAASIISMLMEGKMDEILLGCSRQVMGLSSGFSNTLEPIQVLQIVLLEAYSMIKNSLLLNIQVGVRLLSTQELF
jgi:hypothetical protein